MIELVTCGCGYDNGVRVVTCPLHASNGLAMGRIALAPAPVNIVVQPCQTCEATRAELARLKARSCDSCGLRGHGWRGGVHYRKCMEHSLPCDDLGNICGKWEAAR